MRNRLAVTILIALLVLLALALTGCERDRPVPTPKSTTSPGGGTPVAPSTSSSDMTQVALPTGSGSAGGGQTTATTPVPLGTSGNPTAQPVATSTTPAQGGTSGGGTAGSSGTVNATVNVYIVVAGDTLNGIARKLGLSTQAILAANPDITNPDNLNVGQQINVPSAETESTGATGATGQSPATAYFVQKGDTLSSIAQRFGVSVSQFQQLNDISNPDEIYVGQKLLIPTTTTAPAQTEGKTTYVVQKGDTLNSIAVRYGVTAAQLQKANNISDPNTISPGQVLVIP